MSYSDVTWQIEVAWDTRLTGLFRIDVSLIDGTDTLSGSFGANIYEDVTDRCLGFKVERGRTNDFGAMQKGTSTIVLDDPDGRYNPDNTTSPLVWPPNIAWVDPNGRRPSLSKLVPLRPVRIQAQHLDTTYPVYYGYLERIEHDPDRARPVTTLYCVDLMEWLEANLTISAMGITNVGAAIGEVLDTIGWDASSFRDLDTGDSLADFSADGTKSGLTLIGELLEIDRGVFYISRAGIATYVDRTARWKHQPGADWVWEMGFFGFLTASAASVTGERLDGVKPTSDLREIVNRQTVTRTGGSAQTASDATSIQRYGYRDGGPITSGYLASDTQALHLAEFLVALHKDPMGKAKGVRLLGLDNRNMFQQLSRELGDAVSVTETVSGTSLTGIIEGIRHEVQGKRWTTEWLLSDRALNLFAVGISTLGGGDTLAY